MAASARIIGTGSGGAGLTLTVTLTAAPTATEILLVCGGCHSGPGAVNVTQSFTAVTDSVGGAWKRFDGSQAPRPMVGTTQSHFGGAGVRETLSFDTSQRSSSAGIGIGDVVTCTWNAAMPLTPTGSTGFVLAMDGIQNSYVLQNGFGQYFFSDQNPENFNLPSVLDWPTDVGGPTHVDEDCAMVGIYASYTGNGVSPSLGSVVGSSTSGSVYLAATFDPGIYSGDLANASATFSGGVACAGNYQTIRLTSPLPPPGPTPKTTCTRCGSGLMGLSYRTTRP